MNNELKEFCAAIRPEEEDKFLLFFLKNKIEEVLNDFTYDFYTYSTITDTEGADPDSEFSELDAAIDASRKYLSEELTKVEMDFQKITNARPLSIRYYTFQSLGTIEIRLSNLIDTIYLYRPEDED